MRRCNEIVGRGREKIILQRMGKEYEYPLWNEWSAFEPGIDGERVPPDAETIRADIRDRECVHLLRRSNLRCLVAYGVSDRLLARLALAHQVEQLSLHASTVSDLSFLGAFSRLRHLRIDENSRLTDLRSLTSARTLHTFVLQGVRHVHDLEPLAALPHLIGLSITESGTETIPRPVRVATLAPLTRLRPRALRLGLVHVEDRDLSPLLRHPRFEVLELCDRYALDQLAHVAVHYPHLRDRWRSPRPGWAVCRACGRPMVVTAGRTRRQACAYCHPEQLARWQRRFDRAVEQQMGRLSRLGIPEPPSTMAWC